MVAESLLNFGYAKMEENKFREKIQFFLHIKSGKSLCDPGAN